MLVIVFAHFGMSVLLFVCVQVVVCLSAGSRMPWDEQYLIESLSDSTIYNAYYTVAHLLQGGVVDGSKAGPANIRSVTHAVDLWSLYNIWNVF